MATQLADRAGLFRDLHLGDDTFVMPNAWNAGSARVLEAAGFKALATTSGGVNWSRGWPDYMYKVSREQMLDEYREICAAVDIPVSGDLENGYGATPDDVAETIRLSIECGMVGGGIEDSTAISDRPLLDIELAAERIAAAREAADASNIVYTLTARAESYYTNAPDPFADAVQRVQRYQEAGADCVFVPGIERDAAEIAALVREVDAPVSVVIGEMDPPVPVHELARMGVRRVSTGASLMRATFSLVRDAAREILNEGTFSYAHNMIADADMNGLVAPETRDH